MELGNLVESSDNELESLITSSDDDFLPSPTITSSSTPTHTSDSVSANQKNTQTFCSLLFTWFMAHKLKVLSATIWACMLITVFTLIGKSDKSVGELILDTLTDVGDIRWGPLLFIILYVARLILFIPGSALTIFGGFLFGAWKGMALVLIGANLSAVCAYYIGSYFGEGWFSDDVTIEEPSVEPLVEPLIGVPSDDEMLQSVSSDASLLLNEEEPFQDQKNDDTIIEGPVSTSADTPSSTATPQVTSRSKATILRYTQRLKSNSFETVLIMRFIFLPFDLVSYLAGFLRIELLPFILASAIGILPGTLSFVLLGASSTPDDIKEFIVNGHLPKLDWRALVGSLVMLVLSLLVSQILKRRRG